MFCSNCGKQNEDRALFCAECGSRLTANNPVPETEFLSEDSSESTYAYTPETAYTTSPETTLLNTSEAYFAPPAFPANEMPPAPKKMKNGLKLALILIPVVIVLAVLIGVGSFAAVKLNSPLVKIGKGFSKLVTSGNAYNYNISFDDGYDDVNIAADVKIDLKGKKIDLVNGKSSFDGENVNFEAFLNANDNELGFHLDVEDSDLEMYVYNGYQMIYEDGELTDADYLYQYYSEVFGIEESEINDVLFRFISISFDTANGDKTMEEAEKEIIEIIKKYSDSDIDFDKMNIEVDKKLVKQVQKELQKCLTDKKWLEENLGLTVEKEGKATVYSFNIPIEKAVKALFNILEPLLKDSYDKGVEIAKDSIDEEFDLDDIPTFDETVDEFFDMLEDTDDDISITVDIEMEKSEITAINVTVKEKYGNISDTVKVKVKISKADDFSSPKTDAYKKDIDEAKELIEELKDKYNNYYDDYYSDYYDDNYYGDDLGNKYYVS